MNAPKMSAQVEHYKNVAVSFVSDTFGVDKSISLQILIAFAVVLLTTLVGLIFYGFARSKRRSNAILLLGASNAGKTRIFSLLLDGEPADTVTSMKENVALDYLRPAKQGARSRKAFYLVDVPGAEKIRRQIFDQYKAVAKAIVFVVDSSSFIKEAKDVSEFLYDILSDSVIASRVRMPVLIACNKQDVPIAKSSNVIRGGLEKEFTLLNKTRAASLGSTSGGAHEAKHLGKQGKDFGFDQLRQKIQFLECGAVREGESENASIDPLVNWLYSL